MSPIIKRIVTALTLAAVVVAMILYAPVWALSVVASVLMVLAVTEYVMLLKRKLPSASARFSIWAVLGSLILIGAIAELPWIVRHHGNLMLFYVIAIVKISDMGGFAFGLTSAKLMKGGNHKLCPSISPNKSWEGLFGSIFGSCVISCAFMPFTHFNIVLTLVLGCVAALVGTFGDLVESKFKRWVGVKDSSTMKLTNGMGGILDMLDSLLFAPTAIMLIIRVFAM